MTEVGLETTPQSGFMSPAGSLAESKLAAIIGRRISKLQNI